MRGARCHHAENFITAARSHLDPLGKQRMLPPTAHGDELQKAIRRDVLHQKSHLVHVPGHHHARSRTTFTKHRSAAIAAQLAMLLEFIHKNGPHFVLVTRHRMSLGELLQQRYRFGLHGQYHIGPHRSSESIFQKIKKSLN